VIGIKDIMNRDMAIKERQNNIISTSAISSKVERESLMPVSAIKICTAKSESGPRSN
jgi:hypothetical protein